MQDSRPGLLASVKGLLGTSLTLLQTRLQLLATELEEEGQRLLALILWGGVAVLALGAGLVFVAVFLTVLWWDSNRLLVLGVFAALFVGLGCVATFVAYRLAGSTSGLFSASLAELSKDRAALRDPESE
ncbi:MAG TPA: phage holin family protein [Rhodocyclaceae bacterium]|jgi:uncharacterized membrane protein YqjE|nr:phage holin family protein [Rhodocyclaceae bacterium]